MKTSPVYPRFLGDEAEVGVPPRFAVISAPLAKTLSWGLGADAGPAAILAASPALEVFDDELLQETVQAGIITRPPLNFNDCNLVEACELIRKAVAHELASEIFPVVLGGEHTVSGPAVTAMAARYPDLHVVQVDAHLDLRDVYGGAPLSHASVMRRVADLKLPFTQVGIRSFSGEEWQLVRERGWRPFTMTRIHEQQDWLTQLLATIKGPVYLTIDVDGLDPAIMPATGTPEPDGLSWRQVTALTRALARQPRGLVGLDLVELSPRPGLEHAAYTAAKLIYRTLGYVVAAGELFSCRNCGYCCQGETTVSLDEEDRERMSAHLGLPFAELKRRYLRVSGNTVQMKTVDGHCVFHDNGCTIHESKPWRCRQWPLHPSALADPGNFAVISESCPGFRPGLSHEAFRRSLGWRK
ncbi:MAG: agmatinase [Desulfobulbaceae bacterium]|nr:MAG: agmatinase [Desulfobulbaceae bacterium]